jgi:UDP-N-acetylglucosamine acyltransferase
MIHDGASVHPTAIIHDTAIIYPNVTIDAGTKVYAYAVIGSPPEHKDHWDKPTPGVTIGKNCIIREFTTINAGTTRLTQVGDNVVILRNSYVAHDVRLDDDVTLSPNASIAGKCVVMRGANIGMNASIHQYQLIGPYAMIGAGSVVTKSREIEPFNIYVGVPARFLKVNKIGLDRAGVTDFHMHYLLAEYDKMKMILKGKL